MWFVNADNESDAIVALVAKFATTADTGDPAAAPDTTSPKAGSTDVVVKGELASAMLTGSGQNNTLYFRKESGQWQVCISAE